MKDGVARSETDEELAFRHALSSKPCITEVNHWTFVSFPLPVIGLQ